MKVDTALTRIREFARSHSMWGPDSRLFLAVSGGRDSMSMLYLLRELHQNIVVVHMNFQLRGSESQADEDFVANQCLKLGHEIVTRRVDCETFRRANDLSLQEAARVLRYRWFDSLTAAEEGSKLATGHHADDSIETLFVNLLRGTGISGLTGIPARRGYIVRPLLCLEAVEINLIARHLGVPFREDASNTELRYLRNSIRHQVIPELKNLNAGFSSRMTANMKILQQERRYLDAALSREIRSITSRSAAGELEIRTKYLVNNPHRGLLLQRTLAEYNFHRDQAEDISMLTHQVGRAFYSPTHVLIVQRESLLVKERVDEKLIFESLANGGTLRVPGGVLEMSTCEMPESFSRDPNIEYVDSGMFKGELTVRHWKDGDRIELESGGHQKVKDLLTNIRYPAGRKRDVLVLADGESVVWVVGLRLNASYRIKPGTTAYTRLRWTPETGG